MDKKKKLIIIASSIVAGIVLIAGICALLIFGQQEVIAEAGYNYEKEYHSYCTYPHDDTIAIDGVLDENCWQNKNWFTNTYLSNTEENMPVFDMTSYIDDYGIYIAAVAKDNNIICDGQRNKTLNTNFELYITVENVGEDLPSDYVNTVVFNIDMNGDLNSRITNVDRAVVVEGEINSGATESATLEMFIPWESLNIDKTKGIPDKFYCCPSYLASLTGSTLTSVMKPVWFPYQLPKDSYIFNADGYTLVDKEGAVVGDSKFGHAKTANWDLSKEAEGIIRSSIGTEYHKIFFKENYGSDFIIETTIVPIKGLNNNSPKAGIFFQMPTGVYNAVLLDMREEYLTESVNGTRNFKTLRIAALDYEDAWNMVYCDDEMCANTNATAKEGVKMTVIKYGSQYWVFLDDKFVTTLDYYFMDTDIIPGLFSLGGDVIFKDYSCKEINKETLTEYIHSKNLHMVSAQIGSAGGEVTTSEFSVKDGGSYDINILTNTGFEVSSVLINGVEKLADVQKNAVAGKYTVRNVKEDQEIKVLYKKCEGSKFTGQIKAGDAYVGATVMIKGLTNKALCYKVIAAGEKGFSVILPNGEYQVSILAEGYQEVVKNISISKDVSQLYSISASVFPESLTVNGNAVQSNKGVWNTNNEHLNKISTSYSAGAKTKPLYFNTQGSDFVIETKIDYTTTFQNGREYQPDLMGGFAFTDGINSGYIMVRRSGLVYTDWIKLDGLLDYQALSYPDKVGVNFAVAKKGDTLYAYLEGKLVATIPWSEIVPNADAKATYAIGLYMLADKTADIQFSNYSLKTDTKSVENYIADKAYQATISKPLNGSSLFAEKLTIAGGQVLSAAEFWNTKEMDKGIVKGSYDLSTKGKPLYFNAHGSSILVQADIAYTTVFEEGKEYQWDLFGGFMLSDGKNQGWVTANQTGVTFTDFIKDKELVKDNVLTYPNPKSVKMTMVVYDESVYVYFDDELIWKKRLEVVVPNVQKNADLAVALYMFTDKPADITFSNISISVDKNSVTKYMENAKAENDTVTQAPIAGSSIFADYVTVNRNKLTSAVSNWDLSSIANGVVKGSYALGSKEKPLYFLEHGSSILVEATIDYSTIFKAGAEYQTDLFGGFVLSDGRNNGWVAANKSGVTYTGWVSDRGLIGYDVLTYPYPMAVQMTMAVKDGYIYVYFDDEFIWKQKLETVVPNASMSSELAVGLYMLTDKAADITYRDISIKTDADTVQSYIDTHEDTSDLFFNIPKKQRDYAKLLGNGIIANIKNEATGKVSVTNNTTLFLGDSFFDVREFWTDFYTDDYAGKDVFTAGIGSSRSHYWTEYLADTVLNVFKDTAPKNIVIHVGTNDVHGGGYTTDKVTDNLIGLFTKLHERYPDTKIYYFGITHRDGKSPDNDNVVNGNISQWCQTQDYITYIDTPSLISYDMLKDGIHPKLQYYSIFVEELEKAGCVIEDK